MKITRIVAGIACMLSVGWFVAEWSSKGQEFPFEPLIVFLMSFTTWGWAEIKVDKPSLPAKTVLHPNDAKLAKELRENFPSVTRHFLRDHSFGLPYDDALLKGVEEIAFNWKGAEFEYEYEELRKISSEVIGLSSQLLSKLGAYVGPADNWPQGHYSIPTREERGSDMFSNQTQDRIKEVEGIATEILDNLDKFERAFRKASPESF